MYTSEIERRRDALEKLKYAARGRTDGSFDIDSASYGSKLSSKGSISNAQAWAHTVAKARFGYYARNKIIEDGSIEMIVSNNTPSTTSMSSGGEEEIPTRPSSQLKGRICSSDACCCRGDLAATTASNIRVKRNIIPRPLNLHTHTPEGDMSIDPSRDRLPSTNRVRHFSQTHRSTTHEKYDQTFLKDTDPASKRKVAILEANNQAYSPSTLQLDSMSYSHDAINQRCHPPARVRLGSTLDGRSYTNRNRFETSEDLIDADSLYDEGGGRNGMVEVGDEINNVDSSVESDGIQTTDYVRDTMMRGSSDERRVPVLPRLASWAIKIARAADDDLDYDVASKPTALRRRESGKQHLRRVTMLAEEVADTSSALQTSDSFHNRVAIPDLKLGRVGLRLDDKSAPVTASLPITPRTQKPVALQLFNRIGRQTNVVGTSPKSGRYSDLSPASSRNIRLRNALGTFRDRTSTSSRSPMSCSRYPNDFHTPSPEQAFDYSFHEEVQAPSQRLASASNKRLSNQLLGPVSGESPVFDSRVDHIHPNLSSSPGGRQPLGSREYTPTPTSVVHPAPNLNEVSPQENIPSSFDNQYWLGDQSNETAIKDKAVSTQNARPPTQSQEIPKFTKPQPRRNSVEQYRDELNSLSSLGPEWSNTLSCSSEENHVIHAANFLSSITSDCNNRRATTITSSIMSSIEDEQPNYYPVPSASPHTHKVLLNPFEKNEGQILGTLEEDKESVPKENTLLSLTRLGNRRLKNAASNRVRVAEMRFEKGVPCNALALIGNEVTSLRLMSGFVVSFDGANGDILVSKKKQQKRYKFDDLRILDASNKCLQQMKDKFPELGIPDNLGTLDRPELQRNSLCAYFESRSFPFIFIFETVDDKSDFIELIALNSKKYLSADISDHIETILPEMF